MADAGPSPSQDNGAASRVRGLVQAGLHYVEIRGKLLQIEAQEAGANSSRLGVRLVLALGALFFAGMLFIPAVVVLGAELLKQHWAWMRWEYLALTLGALLTLIGFILLSTAARRWKRVRLFEESLNQLQKDREWLARNQQPPI